MIQVDGKQYLWNSSPLGMSWLHIMHFFMLSIAFRASSIASERGVGASIACWSRLGGGDKVTMEDDLVSLTASWSRVGGGDKVMLEDNLWFPPSSSETDSSA